MLAASPRRNPRRPFRTAPFPRDDAESPRHQSALAANVAPAAAPVMPWWRALLDAVAAAPRRQGAPVAQDDDTATSVAARTGGGRRATPVDDVSAASRENWRPVTERLDRHREQLAGIDDRLRQLVDLQSARQDATAIYAPPA